MKDEMDSLKREVAIAKDKLAESKGANLEPLIELLRDLQAEAITVDGEYYELISSIPEEEPVIHIQVPEEICESDRMILAQIWGHARRHELENKELRILLNRFARAASMYHRIASTVARYPILSTEDLGTFTDRGNWILPADVEHLQRSVIKLHELFIRRGDR
jgi:hypothetical protein